MNFLSKFVLAVILPLVLNIRYKNLKEVYSIKGPFLLLPNHTNQWDPFMLSFPLLRPVRWMAADAVFRDAFKKLLHLCGAIPKVKGQSDMASLEALREGIALGHVGGIFPEGKQCWDGKTGDLIPATAKLIRFLKVPVVTAIIKGGYLSKPKWAWKSRRGRVEVHFRQIINSEEIKSIKLSEIQTRIQEALTYDEYAWQEENRVPLRSEQRAEHLELAHWACPACSEIGTMKSSGNTLSCTCGYTVEIDRYGIFIYPETGPSFKHPSDWMAWQETLLASLIQEKLDRRSTEKETDPLLLQDNDIVLMGGKRARPMVQVHSGEARLYHNRIEIDSPEKGIKTFPLKEITAINTFKQQKFEFRFEKIQYRFRFPSRSISGYKWECACRLLRDELIKRGEW